MNISYYVPYLCTPDTPSHSLHETPEGTAISELDKEKESSEIICIPEIKEKQFITDTGLPAPTSSFVVNPIKGNLDLVKLQVFVS